MRRTQTSSTKCANLLACWMVRGDGREAYPETSTGGVGHGLVHMPGKATALPELSRPEWSRMSRSQVCFKPELSCAEATSLCIAASLMTLSLRSALAGDKLRS